MSESILKGVVLGEGRVGKTSILKRYFNQKFDSGEASTINPAFYPKKETTSDGTKVEINFWDTAGQEMFNSLNKNYYQGAIAALLVYDVNQFNDTFGKVEKWAREITEVVGNDVIFAIAGNKFDLLKSKSEIDNQTQQVNNFCNKYKCRHFVTSAQSGYNINEVFEFLIKKKKKKYKPGKNKKKGLTITAEEHNSNSNNNKKGCC